MKRIKAACLEQTLHFQLKDDIEHDEAVRLVQEEYEQYKRKLDHKRVMYRIVSEHTQEDGSILVEIKKQYLHHEIGNYLKAQ